MLENRGGRKEKFLPFPQVYAVLPLPNFHGTGYEKNKGSLGVMSFMPKWFVCLLFQEVVVLRKSFVKSFPHLVFDFSEFFVGKWKSVICQVVSSVVVAAIVQ